MLGVLRGDGPVDACGRITPSATLTADERLGLYRRGYRLRLLESLRGMHPALRHLLGDEVFDAFALDYLQARPPASYTLFDLDAAFASHLAATRPTSDEAWPDLVIDVVRFERAFLEVYDGAGPEGAAIASAADLVPGAPASVVAVPGVRLLRSRYPVGDYVLAVRRGEAPPPPRPASTHLALLRRDWVVTLVPLTAESHAALEELLAGATAPPGHPWLAAWADAGLFREIRTSRRVPCC